MDGSRGKLELLPDGSLLARIGGPNWKWGEPYEIMVVVVPMDEDAVEIRGLDKHPRGTHWDELERLLHESGYRFWEFDTMDMDGKKKRHRHEIRT